MMSRSPIRARLLLALAVALAARLVAGLWWQARQAPHQPFYFGDSETYWELGRTVAHGGPFVYAPRRAHVFRMPGYPVLLAPVFLLGGDHPDVRWGRVVTAVWGALAVLGVYVVARMFTNEEGALRACWLAALYPGFVAMGAFVLAEAPFTALLLAQLAFWVRALRADAWAGRATWSLGVGFLAAGATLVRPSWLLFTPFVLAMGALAGRAGGRLRGTALVATLALCAGMMPWWIRNYRVTGHLVPTTLQVGASLYDGLNPEATGASDMALVDRLERAIRSDYAGEQLSDVEWEWRLDRDLRRAAVQWAIDHPGRAIQLAWIKLMRMWNPVPNHADFAAWPFRAITAATFVPVVLLGAWGLARLSQRDFAAHLLWLPAVYLTLLHAVFVSSIRYREPAMVGLLVAAAAVGRSKDPETPGNKDGGPPGPRPTAGGGLVMALAVTLAGLACIPWAARRADDIVRRELERRLSRLFHTADVSVKSAEVAPGTGIVARGVTLVGTGKNRAARLEVEQMDVGCAWDLESMLQGNLAIREILLRRPRLFMPIDPNGLWQWEPFIPHLDQAAFPCAVQAKDATVTIMDQRTATTAPIVLEHVDLVVRPTQNQGVSSGARDAAAPMAYDIRGTMHCPLVRHAGFQGVLAADRQALTLTGTVGGVTCTPHWLRFLPTGEFAAATFLDRFQAEAMLDYQVDYQARRERPLEFRVAGRIESGRWSGRDTRVAVTDIRGSFLADSQGFQVRGLTGRMEGATWVLDARGEGYGNDSALVVDGKVADLQIRAGTLDGLPVAEACRAVRRDIDATGTVNAAFHAERRGGTWQYSGDLDLREGSLVYQRFPYRLGFVQGKIHYADQKMTIDISGKAGDQDVQVRGYVAGPIPLRELHLEIKANQIPVDDQLLRALRPRDRRIVQMLNLKGRFDLAARFDRSAATGGIVQRELALQTDGLRLTYERFPYHLPSVRGEVIARNDEWYFGPREPLVALNGTATLACTGALRGTPRGPVLALDVSAWQVPLDAELCNALSPRHQGIWNAIRPQGHVNIACRVEHDVATQATTTALRAAPAGGDDSDVAIQPTFFPYRLEGITGHVHLEGGRMHADRLWARHGRTRLTTGLSAFCDSNPAWDVELPGFRLEWSDADSDLIDALPPGWRQSLRTLGPQGAATVTGRLRFRKGAPLDAPIVSQWDVDVDMARGTIHCGVPLENIWGGLKRFRGTSGAGPVQATGELAVDSLHVRGYQLTGLTGPIAMHNQRIVLGADGNGPGAAQARHIMARTCGGTLQGDFEAFLGAPYQFNGRISLSDAELRAIARSHVTDTRLMNGKVGATLMVAVPGNDLNALQGRGTVAVRQATLYEIPIMVSLLNVLNLKAPDTTAFSDADIDFQVRDRRVELEKIEVAGDLLTLDGRGEVGFDSSVDLSFGAMVGRRDVPIPIVSNIWRGVRGAIGAANKQMLPLRVTGTLRSPDARIEAFPEFFQAVQRLQGDLRRTTGDALAAEMARVSGRTRETR